MHDSVLACLHACKHEVLHACIQPCMHARLLMQHPVLPRSRLHASKLPLMGRQQACMHAMIAPSRTSVYTLPACMHASLPCHALQGESLPFVCESSKTESWAEAVESISPPKCLLLHTFSLICLEASLLIDIPACLLNSPRSCGLSVAVAVVLVAIKSHRIAGPEARLLRSILPISREHNVQLFSGNGSLLTSVILRVHCDAADVHGA